jgi:tRNA uridine 5-carboxymethylaminomethyl modification enzyme
METSYDVIVVGGGHAGSEAAAAAARLGCHTLLVTADLSRIGAMSCNPAIGGIAKGVVVREIDALGGVMGRAADAARIQFRMLNRSRGPAVWGPRAQCDRALYPRAVRRILEATERLDFFQDLVTGPVFDGDRVVGIRTRSGVGFRARAVVVTAGTFLRGRIHVGNGPDGLPAGRAGEAPSVALAEALEARGLEVGRFKTGTPPRVDGRTVDLEAVERQDGDPEDFRFSLYHREEIPEQRPCWITWTGEALQRVVEENLGASALYGGAIAGKGPRYCPSIEDKVVRFPQARRHQVFLEPEGLDTHELYVNGLSTSLPPEVQLRFLRTVPGMEDVRMTRPGYAIEYDYFPPHQLRPTLEVRAVAGLFFAGQINGTTGYEEAAGQGIVAGINAALQVQGRPPLVLRRDQAYVGVLVDDLVTRGVDEPYRLFTSRAEFRLLLRQDNAVRRLGSLAGELGLLTRIQRGALDKRLREEDDLRDWFAGTWISPDRVNGLLEAAGGNPIREASPALELLRRPGVDAPALLEAGEAPAGLVENAGWGGALAAVEVELKYEGYVARERERAEALRAQHDFELREDLPYGVMETLSLEAREKLVRVRPATLAQAGRIPGVSAADLQNLLFEVKRLRKVNAVGI